MNPYHPGTVVLRRATSLRTAMIRHPEPFSPRDAAGTLVAQASPAERGVDGAASIGDPPVFSAVVQATRTSRRGGRGAIPRLPVSADRMWAVEQGVSATPAGIQEYM